MTIKRSGFILAGLLLFLPLASCQLFNSETTQDDIGRVLISVTSIGHWDTVADHMHPKFKLASGDEALAKVMPVTAYLQHQALNTVGLSLGLGTTLPGSITSANALPSAISGANSTNALPAFGSSLGTDPMLQYKTAASLHQYVQLLNKQVELAALREGYEPYLVNMQLVTMPYRRDQPYDVNVTVQFFPALSDADEVQEQWEVNLPLPHVIPLLVTDSLEQSLQSNVSEWAMQLRLALGDLPSTAKAGVDAEHRDRQSEYSRAINSLLTVARVTDNGVQIRLGAVNAGKNKYSLPGRTYDIALLVLVPDKYYACQTNNKVQRLSVVTKTSFLHSITGKLVTKRDEDYLNRYVNPGIESLLDARTLKKWNKLSDDNKWTIVTWLNDPIERGAFATFHEIANNIWITSRDVSYKGPPQPSSSHCWVCSWFCSTSDDPVKLFPSENVSLSYLQSLWVALAENWANNTKKSVQIEMPTRCPYIPSQQAVLREKKEKLVLTLYEVSGIQQARDVSICITGTSTNTNCREEDCVYAESVTVDPSKRILHAEFRPKDAWGSLAKQTNNQCQVVVRERTLAGVKVGGENEIFRKDISFYKEIFGTPTNLSDGLSKTNVLGFTLRSPITGLAIKADGTAEVEFVVNWNEKMENAPKRIEIAWTNAIASLTDAVPLQAAGKCSVSNDVFKITIDKPARLKFALSNVTPLQDVRFTAFPCKVEGSVEDFGRAEIIFSPKPLNNHRR